MTTNEELEKRIEILEKEVQHLKAVLQYQMRSKKKWHICMGWLLLMAPLVWLLLGGFAYLTLRMTKK